MTNPFPLFDFWTFLYYRQKRVRRVIWGSLSKILERFEKLSTYWLLLKTSVTIPNKSSVQELFLSKIKSCRLYLYQKKTQQKVNFPQLYPNNYRQKHSYMTAISYYNFLQEPLKESEAIFAFVFWYWISDWFFICA